ncbi:hypothetical protein RHSIM_RhsimUnG0049400 [Rhododendron simsii]|uniref:MHD domain-containing protein n=1 Tax=Rhododendron simsii TaxID=118357 RepID=A0A834L5H2_RHOSS|nr:hypothetical protein RHSIM_RhsimUnG0049400 [Rhododendron simsii]
MESHSPVGYGNGVTYSFIMYSNVFLMMASRQNCNVASLSSFLYRVVDVFEHYFEELVEESVRDNFVVVYELLDELMYFGYPQCTEASILCEFIRIDAHKMKVTQRPPRALTNAVSWRREQIYDPYSGYIGDIHLDVVEIIDVLVNSHGQVIRSDIFGVLKARSSVRFMPECKLFLTFEDLFEGPYQSTDQYHVSRGEVIDELDDIQFHHENFSVQIHVPLPSDATNPSVQTSIGSASYAPEEYMLRTDFKLPSITSEEAALDRKAPITVQFEIPGFSVSRIKINLEAEDERFGAYKRATCLTVAGDYEVRLS